MDEKVEKMDKYEVLGLIGEGSFGRVYKVKRKSDNETVAMKVIRKRGRSQKELKGLRRECEIQQHLHHPNIIQMLDSFETENEIVVVTEFAHRELHVILGREGFLSEERVRAIVWDLVSALYYLHSHRVLHRDLKPQNILLDSNGRAKLCDFGFARSMGRGTYVLTSIKGTPLYMAPELIDERPYDHAADLWSLGCIVYELLVGAPPFCTASLLHLVSLIRHEQVHWPAFISPHCTSFLKGLLQKDPSRRHTWPEILAHPFVAGHILIIADHADNERVSSGHKKSSISDNRYKTQRGNSEETPEEGSISNDPIPGLSTQSLCSLRTDKTSKKTNVTKSDGAKSSISQIHLIKKKSVSTETAPYTPETHLNKLSQNLDNFTKKIENYKYSSDDVSSNTMEFDRKLSNVDLGIRNLNVTDYCDKNNPISEIVDTNKTIGKVNSLANWSVTGADQPIECEEWLAFLHRTQRELLQHELASLLQPKLAAVLIAPLRNAQATAEVLENVASLLSLPFVLDDVKEEQLNQIKNVYLEIKVVPNLVYACQLVTGERRGGSASSGETPCVPVTRPASLSALSVDELQSLEQMLVLICNLVHRDLLFTEQFCDAVVYLNAAPLFTLFLTLSKRKLRIVTDLIAILTRILYMLPENAELVERIILSEDAVDLSDLLRHSNAVLRARLCILLRLLAKFSCRALQLNWTPRIKDTLEALVYDSIESVRNAAEASVQELQQLAFYDQNGNENL